MERKAWLYLYRIRNDATEEKIMQYIKNKDNFKDKNVKVQEIPGDPNKYKRFVLSAPFPLKDELYKPDFWPENVAIKMFDFNKHRDFLKQQPADFE